MHRVNLAALFADIGQVLAIVLGVVLLAGSMLLYEDDEGKIQSRLETWWIRLDDVRRRAVANEVIFLKGVAETAGRLLDKLYGTRLFSWNVGAVSVMTSAASLRLASLSARITYGDLAFAAVATTLAVLPAFRPRWRFARNIIAGYLVIMPTLAFAIWPNTIPRLIFARMPYPFIRPAFYLLTLGWVGLLVPSFGGMLVARLWASLTGAGPSLPFVPVSDLGVTQFGPTISIAFATAVACNVAVLALSRQLLRWCAAKAWPSRFWVTGLTLLAAAAFSTAGLRILQTRLDLNFALNMASRANVLTALALVISVGVGLVLASHRALWPILQRPLYALARYRVIANHRLLATMGLAFLGLGAPGVAKFLTSLLKGAS
jgi:hypothetical protein